MVLLVPPISLHPQTGMIVLPIFRVFSFFYFFFYIQWHSALLCRARSLKHLPLSLKPQALSLNPQQCSSSPWHCPSNPYQRPSSPWHCPSSPWQCLSGTACKSHACNQGRWMKNTPQQGSVALLQVARELLPAQEEKGLWSSDGIRKGHVGSRKNPPQSLFLLHASAVVLTVSGVSCPNLQSWALNSCSLSPETTDLLVQSWSQLPYAALFVTPPF